MLSSGSSFSTSFFKDAHLDARKVTIVREHSEVLGRPDFWIRSESGKVYIVEVKIWDGHHHFSQYYNLLNGKDAALDEMTDPSIWKRIGYIANYDSIRDVGVDNSGRKAGDLCSVTTWKDFHGALLRYDYFDDPTIAAYAGYVKRVCPFDGFMLDDGWKIDMKDFRAVKNFDTHLKEVIEPSRYSQGKSDSSGVEGVKLYTGSPRRFRSQQWMGQFFEWSIKKGDLSDKTVWGWLGVRYTDAGAVVCVEFENSPGWGDLVCKRYENGIQDGLFEVYAVDSERAGSDEVSLMNFFTEVLKAVQDGSVLSAKDDGTFTIDLNRAEEHLSKSLLAMKCLPFALENHFITDDFMHDIGKAGYEFAFVYGSDQEVPDSHCGRYFELRRKELVNDKSAGYKGWIGVDYNAKCYRKCPDGSQGRNYGDSPSFVLELAKDFPGAEPSELYDNSWGWKCAEIATDDAKRWQDAFAKAREQLLEICVKN